MLIGSANVNQRSMDGQRDTEIAIGCYQTQDTYSNNQAMKRGDIHAYRMSLWYEHSKCKEEELMLEPESLECVRTMRSIGDRMWEVYKGEEAVDMQSIHLVSYPLKVKEDGVVEDVSECGGCFPDTLCPVKGKRSKVLPPISTT